MRLAGPLLLISGLLLTVVVLPPLLSDRARRRQPPPQLSSASAPNQPPTFVVDPALRPTALLQDGLLQRLSDADRAWIPRTEVLPGGGVRYLYKRRPGEPELSIEQIKTLIAHPPSFAAEQGQIVDLLNDLERIGAAVVLAEPIKAGAAAEWDPGEGTLRIRPDVVAQGSLEFASVLNHEAVHVAQSCNAGSLRASPRVLGALAAGASGTARAGAASGARIEPLKEPLYAGLSPAEQAMEQEAYALQDQPGVGRQLIGQHCRGTPPG